jgi:hypothetical protein
MFPAPISFTAKLLTSNRLYIAILAADIQRLVVYLGAKLSGCGRGRLPTYLFGSIINQSLTDSSAFLPLEGVWRSAQGKLPVLHTPGSASWLMVIDSNRPPQRIFR